MARPAEAGRCFPSRSPTLRPWIAGRRLRSARRSPSYVEELWSPSLTRVVKNDRLKPTQITGVHFPAHTLRVFLSQAGPRCRSITCFKLSITSGSDVDGHEKGDPLGRPHPACYAARELARTPPGEGVVVTEPAARPGRDDQGRPGGVRLRIVIHLDHVASEHRPSAGVAQGFHVKIQ